MRMSKKDLSGRVEDLEAQVAALTARVEESAVLNQRFAELLDVVTELLPAADPAAVERARATTSSPRWSCATTPALPAVARLPPKPGTASSPTRLPSTAMR